MILSKAIKLTLAASVLTMGASAASAHTIALGTTNAGSPGSVSIWLGNYPHGGSSPNEGSITLDGVTQAFNLLTNTLPAGLVLGTNYFFSPATSSQYGSIAAGTFNSTTNNTGLGNVTTWQGATFTGLAAGTYSYQISGMNTAHWNDINSLTPNWTGSVTISNAVASGVPEPTTMALFGLGLIGAGLSRRKSKAA